MRTIDSAIMDRLAAKELRPFVLLDLDIDSVHYRYTDCDAPIVVGGDRYEPRGFKLEPVRYSLGTVVDSAKMQVDNLDNVLTPVFVGGTPQGSEVTIKLVLMDTLGQELIANSSFDSNINSWTNFVTQLWDTFEWVATQSIHLAAGAAGSYKRCDSSSFAIVSGHLYEMVIVFRAIANGTLKVDIVKSGGGVMAAFSKNITASGTYKYQIEATESDAVSKLALWRDNAGSANLDVTIDRVSLREITSTGQDYCQLGDPVTLFQGTIDGWDLDEEKVSLTVASELVQWSQRTLAKHSSSCRWKKFKGTECTYAGAEVWCDRTYTRCAALSNQANFGGFRWLPSIIDKEIWWGPSANTKGSSFAENWPYKGIF